MAFPTLHPLVAPTTPAVIPSRRSRRKTVEHRILYGSERTEVKLSLSYANIGDANAEQFLDHYDEVQGTFSTFDLPDNALAGWSSNTDA